MSKDNIKQIAHYLCSAGHSYETIGFDILEQRISLQELPLSLKELQGQIDEALELIKREITNGSKNNF